MPWPEEITAGTKQFVSVLLDSVDNLTTSTVEIGFSADAASPPTIWVAATWPLPGINLVRTTVVWDTTSVTPGHYKVWVRITDNPEILPKSYGVVRVV